MVLIRKALEAKNELGKRPTLRFFCDWVLHCELDREGAKGVVQLFDKMHGCVASAAQPSEADSVGLAAFLSTEGFRVELHSFLNDEQLPNSVLGGEAWRLFFQNYALVVAGAPLRLKGSATGIESVDLSARVNSGVLETKWTPFFGPGYSGPSITIEINLA